MTKFISIDPGKYKCGLVLADITERIIYEAIIVKSELLKEHVKHIKSIEEISKVIIGNGTTSDDHIKKLDFIKNDLVIVEEKNTTYRAKERFFELFPIRGLRNLVPREILILNINLDAISALIILEDYFKSKFTMSNNLDFKTWQK